MEGHTIIEKGKKYFVKDYKEKFFEFAENNSPVLIAKNIIPVAPLMTFIIKTAINMGSTSKRLNI